MKSIEFLETPSKEHQQLVSFVVFEPHSHRIDEDDVLVRGQEVHRG